MTTRALRRAAAAILLAGLPALSLAEDPMKVGGLAPMTVQEGDTSGAVNVMNGALNYSYPLGPVYRVNEALSYNLTLNYSSENHRWQRSLSDYLRGRSPVAHGWTMHFGRLADNPDKDPSDGSFAYQSPDGVWHPLRLVQDSTKCAPHASCYLSNDSTWIRAKRLQPTGEDYWLVWTPDGVERELKKFIAKGWTCQFNEPSGDCTTMDDFEGWYTTAIWDPSRTDSVTVEYETDPAKTHCLKRVYDSVRGISNPTLTFENASETDLEPDRPGARGGLTRKVFARIADGTATYRLENTGQWFFPDAKPCQTEVDAWPEQSTNVNLLDAIVLELEPGNELRTDFSWPVVPILFANDNRYLQQVDQPGELGRAQYTWTCDPYSFGKSSCLTCPCESDAQSKLMVVEKRMLRGSGALCDGADVDCWSYDRELSSADRADYSPCGTPVHNGCPPATNPNKVTVTLPETLDASGNPVRHQRIHYFNSGYNPCDHRSCPEWWELPSGYKNGLEREVVYLTGGQVTQTTFTDYESDSQPPCNVIPADGPHNVRVVKRRTTVLTCDDPPLVEFTERELIDYDGVGHYQVAIERTNSGLASRQRRTETRYTPTAADYQQWFLGRTVKREVYDSETADATKLQFQRLFDWDEHGRLWMETRKGLGVADILVHQGWSGHRKLCEAWSGGDSGITAPELDGAGHVDCSAASLGCNANQTLNRAYGILQAYDNGAVVSRGFKGLGHLFEDLERAASGAVTAEHDPINRYSKRFSRDLADRVTEIVPDDDAGSGDEDPIVFNWVSPTELEWWRDTTLSVPAGSVKYDAYGRRRQTRVEDPDDGDDLVKVTFTDALGNMQCDGDWQRTSNADPFCLSGIHYRGFDVLGRPGRVLLGSLPNPQQRRGFSYCGQTTTEHRWIWNGVTEDAVDVTFERDGFGRLVRVNEPIGTAGPGERTTTYGYDALDRLIGVTMTDGSATQERIFEYDAHGNLRTATEPESGTMTYSEYDARGNLLQSTDAAGIQRDRTYDCAGRLVAEQALDTAPTPDLVVGSRTHIYDGGGAKGRRTRSQNTNLGGEVVIRGFEYSGRMGRMSKATTELLGKTFEQTLSYDSLGLPDTLGYPATSSDLEPTRSILDLASDHRRGFLETLKDDSTGRDVLTNVHHHASGVPDGFEIGVPAGSPTLFIDRDFDSHGRLLGIAAEMWTMPTTTLFDTGVIDYDRMDNIKSMNRGGSDVDQFSYFRDSSLATATMPGFSAIYAIDAFSNLKGRNGPSQQWQISTATNQITSSGYNYSTAGNMLTDPLRLYTWDGFERLAAVNGLDIEATHLYDADGMRVDLNSPVGCLADHRIAVRDEAGRVLSEFRQGAELGCEDQVVWLRDYIYADGRLLTSLVNGSIAPPSIELRFACNQEVSFNTANPEVNLCRTAGVNLYRRSDTGSYDFSAPINPSPNATMCPGNGRVTDSVPSNGAWCWVALAVHWSGNLSGISNEICLTTPATSCNLDHGFGCPTPPVPATGWNRRHHFTDHLGTPRMTVNAFGDVLETLKLAPFGEVVDPTSCQQRAQFTGHERDSETGLDYMRARYYQQGIGRFLSTDPLRNTNLANPQGWNAYAYVLNNPVNATDPTGMAAETFWDLFNVGLGVTSLATNIASGNVLGAVVDVGGMFVDGGATLVPFLPGGAGAAIKAARAADKVADAAKAADKAADAARVATGGGDTVTGYRAVSRAEADDIAQHGFRPEPSGRSMEDKWFSESRQGAEAFRERLAGLDEIVEAGVPRSVYDRSYRHPNIDGTGPGFCVRCQDLPLVRPRQ